MSDRVAICLTLIVPLSGHVAGSSAAVCLSDHVAICLTLIVPLSGHVAVFICSCVSLSDHNSYVPHINCASEWPCACFCK